MATRNKKNRPTPSGESGSGSTELLKKKMLGRYELQRKLGAGGMGAVYLALDTELNRLVALKILPPEKAANPTLVKRFKAEAQAVAQLTHDNIVRVYESGEIDGYQYIALEYVEGTDVHRLVKKRGRLPVRRATEIITQVAQALDHAYQEGIVHRDIKPANLLITQAGVVKLTDLGLARVLDENEETSITRAGTTVGTVDYMAPEQARSSKAADVRSDIYSLGCAWYHMLTGSPPYPDGSVTNKLQAHAVSRVPDPRSLNESVPESVVGVIQRMMAKKPEERHQTPRELLDDLKAVKASKKEISADDLAALAGEAEEEVVASRRTREAESDEVASSSPTRKRRSGKKNKSGASTKRKSNNSTVSGSSEVIPPRERRRLSDEDPEEKKQLNLEPFVYAGIALGLVLMVGGLYYVISGVGQAVNQEDNRQVNLLEESEALQEERLAEADAAEQASTGEDSQATDSDPRQRSVTKTSPIATDTVASTNAMEPQQMARSENWPTVRVVDASVTPEGNTAHTINAAIAKTDARKFVVELQTTAPINWDEPVILDGRTMILRSGKEGTGLVVISSAGPLSNGLLTVRKGALLLEGLHFGLLGYELSGDKTLTLMRLADSDLIVRDCTFTLEESRAAPVTLCNFSQTNGRTLNCSWERSLIRGSQWQPFQCDTEAFKFLFSSGLIFTDKSPVLTLTSSGKTNANLGGIGYVQRDIVFTDSYVVCSGTAISVENPSGSTTVPFTHFRFNRSAFVATAGTGNQPFAEVRQWPENVLSSAGKAKLSRFEWVSEQSQFAGWKTRLNATTSRTRTAFSIASQTDWQKFWGNPGLSSDWSERGAGKLQPGDLSEATLASLTGLSLTASARPAEQTQSSLQQIRQPALSSGTFRSAVVRLNEPKANSLTVAAGNDVTVLKLDATRDDLGEFLASRELPANVIVEVTGFGLRTCSPIRIDGSNVHIRCIATDKGPPLTFRPVPARQDKSGKSQPWISVKNGSLHLQDGVFRMDPPSRNPMPSAWVQGAGSDIRLQNCYVTGPASPHKNLSSLVQAAGQRGGKRSRLQIDRCYFEFAGDLVQADLADVQVQADNSVLVSQQHLFSLSHSRKQSEVDPGRLMLENCTLSARNGAIHFDIAEPSSHQRPHVEAFVRECAFVPAVDSSSGDIAYQTILSSTGPLEKLPRNVWWWGTRNGFAPQLSRSFGTDHPLETVWPKFWGTGHVKDPLFGAEGVLLKDGTIDAKNLRPSSFALYEKCQAANWAEDQTAIGADAAALDLKENEQERPSPRPLNKNEQPKKPTMPRF